MAFKVVTTNRGLARKAGIATKQNAHARPAGGNLFDDAGDLFRRAGAAVDVGGPELGRQKMPAAEHVKRQVAVAIVIGVEKPPLLIAVQRIVRRVEIEDDL